MSEPLYSVGTWDCEAQAYTPQDEVPAFNLTIRELRASLRAIRQCGYGAWRTRGSHGDHYSDWAVLVERTDGLPEHEILEGWKR
jgi:hypothetical protein